uniref:Glutathione peroxidase n=1 Tax=Trichobilharzia regenti TaxID=157069 RepID=A0AA85J6T2_TRIRE|nr:unnamed protein product [Trichobilharzia regenti]
MSSSGSTNSIYDFSAKDINGIEVPLEKYRGHVCLIVNVACLRILAFPCNQFGSQEPWPEAEIKKFVTEKYGVEFDMFSKINVNGPNAHPLFKFLKNRLEGTLTSSIKWNFTKFLVDREGQPVKRYSPTTAPLDIQGDILELLEKK